MIDKEGAYTEPSGSYPAYLNVRRRGDEVIVTVRGAPIDGAEGPLASINLSSNEFRRVSGDVTLPEEIAHG